jgi:hypothetical protein
VPPSLINDLAGAWYQVWLRLPISDTVHYIDAEGLKDSR